MTRLLNNGTTPLRYKDKLINEKDVYFADQNLFDVFSVNVLKGNPKTALADPFTVMLTEETAKKYFGNEDPINKVLRANNQFDVKVTGVYKAFPANAHLHPNILVSFNTLKDSTVYGEEGLRTNWGNNSFFTYLLLPNHYNIENMKARFPAFLDKHMEGQYGANKPSQFTKLDLQKLTDIHLYSHTDYEAEPNGDVKRVYVFSAIALFILLIACINYMNLSTARSALRAREIGIRKVVGARKRELVIQFLTESVVITWSAIIIGFILLYLALPWLNKAFRTNAFRLYINEMAGIAALVPFTLFHWCYFRFVSCGLHVIVPASEDAQGTIQGAGQQHQFSQGAGGFAVCDFYHTHHHNCDRVQQLRYMQTASLGYDKEHILTLAYNSSLNDQYESFRNTLLQNPAIKDVGRSSRIPTGDCSMVWVHRRREMILWCL
jgi:putative ABC transport system permease protein